jgi:hypothetical protein
MLISIVGLFFKVDKAVNNVTVFSGVISLYMYFMHSNACNIAFDLRSSNALVYCQLILPRDYTINIMSSGEYIVFRDYIKMFRYFITVDSDYGIPTI